MCNVYTNIEIMCIFMAYRTCNVFILKLKHKHLLTVY